MDGAYKLTKRLDETELIFPLHTPIGSKKPDFDSDDDSSWSEIEVIELESNNFDTLSENEFNESRINFTEEFGAMSVKMPDLPASDSESEEEEFSWAGMSKIEQNK